MPLPLGAVLSAIDIILKLVTINGPILNLYIKTGNYTATIPDLSTPLPLGVILIFIDINWKLVTINAKSMGTILNLQFVKTGNDNSLAVKSLESLYQLMYLSLYVTS